jgi:2,5-diketo-D-gluconate reductase B
MKYENILGLEIPKIGFGTWRIGGGSRPDPKSDPVSLTALHTALEVGYTHFDTAEMYADGHTEELVGRAVHNTNTRREDVFITTKVSPEHLAYGDVIEACENSLRRINMEYIDLYLIHWPTRSISKLDEAFPALNKLVHDGRVRHLGVSNFNLKWLTRAQELSETPIFTNQVPYSLTDRSYVQNGGLENCRQNDILLTAYEPVDKGRLKEHQVLRSVAEAHGATTYQIALAWLVSQPRVITIPMSHNPKHIRENFEAADIDLSERDLSLLSSA